MKNSQCCRIGLAGLDTSHVTAFARLLHETHDPWHVPGGRIVAGYPGGSSDFEKSISRVDEFTTSLREKYGVEMMDSLGALLGKCDAIMLESIDGRVHLEQFREVAEWDLPVFIDKPLTVSSIEARELCRIAVEKNVRVSSASALRFAEAFRAAIAAGGDEPVIGADVHGPMPFVEGCPGYFWYGIHAVEMLLASMGEECREVLAVSEEGHDLLVGRWSDGRIGTIRGNRVGNKTFGGMIHRPSGSLAFDLATSAKPYYASLLEEVIPFFHGNRNLVTHGEMILVVRFLEAANESAATGEWTAL